MVSIEKIRGTDEYKRGRDFGEALANGGNIHTGYDCVWTKKHEWGDAPTNYKSLARIVEEDLDAPISLAVHLGRWEGYSDLIDKSDRLPVPQVLIDALKAFDGFEGDDESEEGHVVIRRTSGGRKGYFDLGEIRARHEVLEGAWQRWDRQRAPSNGIWLRTGREQIRRIPVEQEVRMDIPLEELANLPDPRDHVTPGCRMEQWNLFVKVGEHENDAVVTGPECVYIRGNQLTREEARAFCASHGISDPRRD